MTVPTIRPGNPAVGPAPRATRRLPKAPFIAVLTGLVAGGLIAAGGALAAVPLLAVLAGAAALLHTRRGAVLPLLALASAATPPLLVLPFFVVVGGKSLYLSDILIPLATLLALTRRTRIPRFDLVVWAYTAVIVLQAAVGIVRKQPFEAFTQDLRGPVYIVCGYFIASRLYTPAARAATVRVAGLVLWYSAALMSVTILTGVELLSGRTEGVRAFTVGGPELVDATRFIVNSKGLAFMVLVAGITVLVSRRSSPGQRWVAALLSMPAFLITFLGYARATLLAFLLCLALLVLLTRAVRTNGARVAGVALAVVAAISLLVLSGSGSLLNDPEGNPVARQVAGFETRVIDGFSSDSIDSPGNTYRLLENRYALQTAARNPLFGQGIGAQYHPPYLSDPVLQAFKTDPEFGSRFIHNGWLWYAVKTGAVGLVAFLAMILIPVIGTIRRRGGTLSRPSPADLGLAVSLCGLLVIHAFEPDIHRVGTAPVVGAVLGYLALRAARRRALGAPPEVAEFDDQLRRAS